VANQLFYFVIVVVVVSNEVECSKNNSVASGIGPDEWNGVDATTFPASGVIR
jgi:hypothetical protein